MRSSVSVEHLMVKLSIRKSVDTIKQDKRVGNMPHTIIVQCQKNRLCTQMSNTLGWVGWKNVQVLKKC